MTFDVAEWPDFLSRLPAFIDSGFDAEQIDAVLRLMETIADAEQQIEFPVTYDSRPMRLALRLQRAGPDAVTIFFESDRALADRILEEAVEWQRERL